MRGPDFTKREDEFIRENYMDMTDKEIAAELGRPAGGVTNRRKNVLGLTKYTRREWTPEEEQIVKDLYPDTPNSEIMEKLPRHTIHSLYRKAHAMGLKKTDEFRYQLNARLGKMQAENNEAFKANQFEKGNEPANKGLRQEEYMSEEAIEATKKTRFKNGHKPHNTKWDGAITIRHDHPERGGAPYAWIRLSEGEWEQYSRHQYKKHHGPIPDGMMVTFRDGNTLNCFPDNLTLISREDNARRNYNKEKAIKGFERYREEHGGSPSEILSDGYVASLLAGGDQDLKAHILEHEQEMISTARAYYKHRRKIMETESQLEEAE